jgi:hypothetical protein
MRPTVSGDGWKGMMTGAVKCISPFLGKKMALKAEEPG